MNIIWMGSAWERRFTCQLMGISHRELTQSRKNLIHPDFFEELNTYVFENIENDINTFEKFIDLELGGQKNILIVGTLIRPKEMSKEIFFKKILDFAKKIKPKISFIFSDEWGDAGELNDLCKYSKIVFRQYRHKSYNDFSNLFHLPLGYHFRYIEQDENYFNHSFLKASKREFAWSFVGNIGFKKPRGEMIDKMSSIKPYYLCADDSKKYITEKVKNKFNGKRLLPYEMKRVMDNSIFAPNEVGNRGQPDCLRLYESSMCGAIPVVCFSEEEFNFSFGKYNFGKEPKQIPWLRFENWEEASNECKKILKDPSEIERLSKENFKWWKNTVFNYKNKIIENLI